MKPSSLAKERKVILRMIAPASLMLYSIRTYPQYGACEYYFDGQVIELITKTGKIKHNKDMA